jgi:hypothetical protein
MRPIASIGQTRLLNSAEVAVCEYHSALALDVGIGPSCHDGRDEGFGRASVGRGARGISCLR